jgi:hypothetical protein
MRCLGAIGVLTILAGLAFVPLGCNPGGVTGPGGFCDPDVPWGTSGAFRQYEKDLIKCTPRGPPYVRSPDIRRIGPPTRFDRAD